LDLFVLAVLIVLCSAFGLPWFVAATVESVSDENAFFFNPLVILLTAIKIRSSSSPYFSS